MKKINKLQKSILGGPWEQITIQHLCDWNIDREAAASLEISKGGGEMTLSEKNLECLLVLNFDTLRFLITTEKENENHKNLNFFLGSFLYPPIKHFKRKFWK